MYRIASVTPRGRSPTTIASFTVVVGPNNAGKSQMLRDITLCASGQNEQAKVLEDVGIDLGPSAITFLRNLVTRMGPNEAGQHYLDGAGISLNDMSSRAC